MKIVFWGSESGCGTTSNMLILAGYFACQRGYRIVLAELAKETCEIEKYFQKPRKYFAKEWIEILIMDRLYYIPKEAWKGKEMAFLLEKNMDMVFLNFGNRMDSEAREWMHNADITIVNLQQSWKAFDAYYAQYANLSARIFLLVGSYLENDWCSKEHLRKHYGLKPEELGIIPNNPEYHIVCQIGLLERYMRKTDVRFISSLKQDFLKEVENTAELLFQIAEKR